MNRRTREELESFMDDLRQRNPGEEEFHQAVFEVATDVFEFIADRPEYQRYRIMSRLTEPDRVVSFRVSWEDDAGDIQVNRGWRVQNSNAIGPYKGGIRFHPSVNQGILKFLAFEQTFKNSLTGLPLGGAKGGADFDPAGRSDHEVMRFCQSYMTELHRHLGEDVDVPAGDIGVGQREIGYLFGQYKRITNRFVGVLTGKAMEYGGSHLRSEATGYGTVYFMQAMLDQAGRDMDGADCLVSGSGNVARHAARKIILSGGRVLTLSDSDGFIHDPEGITEERLDWITDLKENRRGRIRDYAEEFGVDFHEGKAPWSVPARLAFPCATQNEIDADDATGLIENGIVAVAEGANMPCRQEAIEAFIDAGVLFGPSKAANAGGVAVSGLEMSQNSAGETWEQSILRDRLQSIMEAIHHRCLEADRAAGGSSDTVNYVRGANIAGFEKVADALVAYGVT